MFAKSALTLASLALFAQAASAAACTRTYTIKEGDYCDSISAANGVSTYQLAVINAGKINAACDNLVPGEELCLGTDEADCKDTTVVIPGNTCEAIWNEHGIEEDVFYQNNPQVSKDCTNIYIDEVLCVSKTVQVPAPPPPNVPIHTGPPASEATPPVPLPSSTPPAQITPAPVNVAPVPSPTTPPANAAPSPAPATPEHEHEDGEECEDEEEELEVVEGDTDEDLPFCDEL